MQAWAGFAGVGAVVWVALRSRDVFDTWLQQKQTERRLDVAEKLLFLVYKAEDVFNSIRSPASFGSEVERVHETINRSFPQGVPESRRQNLEIGQTILIRIQDHGDFWAEYLALRPQVRAYFGQAYADKYGNIWTARAKIIAAAGSYGRIDPTFEERDPERAQERRDHWEAVFWDGWAEAIDSPDEIRDLLAEVKIKTEEVVQPLLATKS
jgi:hypothetical protein